MTEEEREPWLPGLAVAVGYAAALRCAAPTPDPWVSQVPVVLGLVERGV